MAHFIGVIGPFILKKNKKNIPHLFLLPKCQGAARVGDYRAILLSNSHITYHRKVLQKNKLIIAKVLSELETIGPHCNELIFWGMVASKDIAIHDFESLVYL